MTDPLEPLTEEEAVSIGRRVDSGFGVTGAEVQRLLTERERLLRVAEAARGVCCIHGFLPAHPLMRALDSAGYPRKDDTK